MPKISKRASIDVNPEDEFAQCFHILNLLKRHKNAQPFSRPVNPEADNVPDYLEIIKEPKDFSTIETNLIGRKYANAAQFHADICKIWSNGYLYNKKNSIIYKYTV